ncbi:MAG: LysM peptidoglycan-binding domain-containing protein [Clostridiales bacterium]|nr:LysM peptidoglycan-binding domain-containing protein [Clostridiales bacterium]
MIIHVIEPGETVDSIAQLYGVSPEWIIREHGIIDPNDLAVGGSLVILYPEITHTVVEGDTLESIANMYGVSVISLLQNNFFLSDQEFLQVGDSIVIKYQDEKKRAITVTGYCYPFIEERVLRKTLPSLTYLIVYSYLINVDGSVRKENDELVIEYARAYGVPPIMMVSINRTGEVLDSDMASTILNNEELRNFLINDIIVTVITKGYAGIGLMPLYIYPTDRALYVEFLEELINRVQALGLIVFDTIIIDTFELISDIFSTQSYIKFLNALVDGTIFFPISTGIRLDAPMGVSSYGMATDMLTYFLEYIPTQELQLGINTVGFIWELPYIQCLSEGNTISVSSAILLARDYDIPILYDEVTQSAFFLFQDDNQELLVRFRDARSYAKYMELVDQYNLEGIGVWNIMSYIHPLWLIVNSQYEIIKVDL